MIPVRLAVPESWRFAAQLSLFASMLAAIGLLAGIAVGEWAETRRNPPGSGAVERFGAAPASNSAAVDQPDVDRAPAPRDQRDSRRQPQPTPPQPPADVGQGAGEAWQPMADPRRSPSSTAGPSPSSSPPPTPEATVGPSHSPTAGPSPSTEDTGTPTATPSVEAG